MRLLVIVPSYMPAFQYGGPIRSIAALAQALSDVGHSVTVYTTNANGSHNLDVDLRHPSEIKGVTVFYHNRIIGGHVTFSPSLWFRLWRNVQHFDAVHIQSWWNLVAIPAAAICLLRGRTPIISPRGSLTSYTLSHGRRVVKKWMHRLIGRILLRKSIIHSTSAREDEEAAPLAGKGRRVVIPNLLDLPAPAERLTREDDPFTVLFLGRLDPAKHIELLIDVFRQSFPFPARLILAGDGPEFYVHQLKDKVGEEAPIYWVGPVSDSEKWGLLASSDLVVLPSHTENFGNVVLESLSQGTPVLVSPGVGLKDYILDRRLGWMAEADIRSWRETVLRIQADKAGRAEIRARAAGTVREDFDRDVLIRQYENLYNMSA